MYASHYYFCHCHYTPKIYVDHKLSKEIAEQDLIILLVDPLMKVSKSYICSEPLIVFFSGNLLDIVRVGQ